MCKRYNNHRKNHMTFTLPSEKFYGESQYEIDGRVMGWLERGTPLIARQAVDGSGLYKRRCLPNYRCGNAGCHECGFAVRGFFAETIAETWQPDSGLFEVSFNIFVNAFLTFADTDATIALAVREVLWVPSRVPLTVAGGFHLVPINGENPPSLLWCFRLNLLVGGYDGDAATLKDEVEGDWVTEARVAKHDNSKDAITGYLLDATFPNVLRHLHPNPAFRADQPKGEGDRKKLRQWLYGRRALDLTIRANF
jgi:hypothetical protein